MKSLSTHLSGKRGHSFFAIVREKLNEVFKSESVSIAISGGQVAGSSLWEMDLTRAMPLGVTCSPNIIENSLKGTIK